MNRTAFRFLHASDLFLERPVEDVGDCTPGIETRLLNAPLEAARRVFHLARAEVVDFILLSGNVVDPNTSGCGPLLFLLEQFQMLHEAGIPVYWAGSDLDQPEFWPAALELPPNVHFFPTGNVEEFIVLKEKVPVARILGLTRGKRRPSIRASQFAPDPSGLYTIVLTNGRIRPESVRRIGIPFWALGGSRQRRTSKSEPTPKEITRMLGSKPAFASTGTEKDRKTTAIDRQTVDRKEEWKSFAQKSLHSVSSEELRSDDFSVLSSIVHYPGPTLARSSRETGQFGATLVDVSVEGLARLTFFPVSPLRFIEETIELESGAGLKQLRSEMQKRLTEFRAVKSRDDLMISWIVDCPGGPLPVDLRNSAVGDQLLEEFRNDFGVEPPVCWSISITPTIPELLPNSVYDQKTILGDYLRAVQHLQSHPYDPINLGSFLPKDVGELPFGEQLPLTLPHEVQSDITLKQLLTTNLEKASEYLEKIEADRIRRRLRKRLQEKGESTEKREPSLERIKRQSRRRSQQVVKQLKMREGLLRGILREAAILGWDLLGNDETPRTRKSRSPDDSVGSSPGKQSGSKNREETVS